MVKFDVFLCHNSKDKPEVREIAQQLRQLGLNPWLDEWELRPGLSWQELLEEQISQIKTAAVFVGSSGFGPWQEREMRAFLSEFVDRDCPVIPVLLKNAPEKPKLPIFLKTMTWVDFRQSQSMERLIWGITGNNKLKPRKIIESKEIEVSNLLFQKLEQYLKNRQWQEADEETFRLMIQIGDKRGNEKRYLDMSEIENFPCEELRTISDLWERNSDGKFGLIVQRQMWVYDSCGITSYHGEKYDKFATKVGWRTKKWLQEKWYEDMIYDIAKAPKGHLPTHKYISRFEHQRMLNLLCSRMKSCKIGYYRT